MIITRAPLRISLGGGGTDLPSYYRKFGGELIAGAIDKYVYIALHKTFQSEFMIKYSQYERVTSGAEIRHPIIREAIRSCPVDPQLEIVSFADIPDGTGLGSSGSFTVALLKALSYYRQQPLFTEALAAEACDIEINRLAQPIGKQDQYASAYGGITSFKFNPDETVEVVPLQIPHTTLQALEDHLLLFFTGYSRSASAVLAEQKQKSESMEKEMIDNLHFTKELGAKSRAALEQGNLTEFASLMHVHWENKRKRSRSISMSEIDGAYREAMDSGALGGKLIGAGGGGFLMFYSTSHAGVRKAMAARGLREVRFKFDFEGAKVVTV